jgi:hypothetical protein
MAWTFATLKRDAIKKRGFKGARRAKREVPLTKRSKILWQSIGSVEALGDGVERAVEDSI